MTANKLADAIEKGGKDEFFQDEIVSILRQQQDELDAFKLNYYNTGYSLQLRDKDETIKKQQAEIGRLKQIIDANNLNQNIGQFVKPVNEPVAWAYIDELDNICEHGDWQINVTKTKEYSNQIGLFAYPNEDQVRELSDEKIWKLWQTHLNDDITVFARAIEKRIKNGN